MRLLSNISKNIKILAGIGIAIAIGISFWLGNSREVDRLLTIVDKGNHQMRLEALAELGGMGSSASSASEDLSILVRNRDRDIRSAATYALMRISSADALEALLEALGSRDSGVRLDAREALERTRHPKAIAALEQMESKSTARYHRTRLDGWASKIRRGLEKEKERKYKRHRKVYDKYRR